MTVSGKKGPAGGRPQLGETGPFGRIESFAGPTPLPEPLPYHVADPTAPGEDADEADEPPADLVQERAVTDDASSDTHRLATDANDPPPPVVEIVLPAPRQGGGLSSAARAISDAIAEAASRGAKKS